MEWGNRPFHGKRNNPPKFVSVDLCVVWCPDMYTVAVRCVYATVPISDPISFNRNFVILEEVHDVNYLDRRLPYELCTMNT